MSLIKKMPRWLQILVVVLGSIYILPAFCSYQGYIVNADTKEPVEGVVVYIEFLQGNLLEGEHTVGAAETRTNKDGYFSLPFRGWSFNPFGMLLPSNLVSVFKTGYEPVYLLEWKYLKDPSHQTASISRQQSVPLIWKIEWGKPYILLKKYKDLEDLIKNRRRGTTTSDSFSPGDVANKKWKLMREEEKKEEYLLFPERKSR
jgi:hypothetical protein